MTVRRFKKSHLFIIITSIIVAVGLAAFIIASGVSNGWDSVARWFGSNDAILLYILLGSYALLIAGFFIFERIKRL